MITTGITDIGFDVRVSDAPLTADERERILAAPQRGPGNGARPGRPGSAGHGGRTCDGHDQPER